VLAEATIGGHVSLHKDFEPYRHQTAIVHSLHRRTYAGAGRRHIVELKFPDGRILSFGLCDIVLINTRRLTYRHVTHYRESRSCHRGL
jgi:hypothetical protein